MKIFVDFINGFVLRKSVKYLTVLLVGVISFRAMADCVPTSGAAYPSTTSISLSINFTTENLFTSTFNTDWNGHFTCSAGSITGTTFYYLSGLKGGYPVRFVDTSKGLDQIITFNATPAKTSSWFWAVGTNNVENTDYTLTATLGNTSSYGVLATTTTGKVQLIPIALVNNNTALPDWIRANYLTSSAVKAYTILNVAFNPSVTTCSVDNQNFALPPVTLAALRTGTTNDTNFNFSINCSGQLNKVTTRPVNLRLYSNDIVDENNNVIRNNSSTSKGIGFQLFTSTSGPLRFKSTPDISATSLWSMSKASPLTQSATVEIGARYKIFDNSKASSGSVVGTVIAYFDYD